MQSAELRKKLKRVATSEMIPLIGFTNAERWTEYHETGQDFYPQSIWPWCRTVIVLGVPIFLPILESSPSVIYSELDMTARRVLDAAAYKFSCLLNKMGHRTHYLSCNGYLNISELLNTQEAAFSHVLAAKYAGLGTIGMSHSFLTKEFGPRVRLVSVITDAYIKPDSVMTENLCTKCGQCISRCPMQVFKSQEDDSIAEMDKLHCAEHQQSANGQRYPCGICTAVCPVGEDRILYGKSSVSTEGIEHVRSFGAK